MTNTTKVKDHFIEKQNLYLTLLRSDIFGIRNCL